MAKLLFKYFLGSSQHEHTIVSRSLHCDSLAIRDYSQMAKADSKGKMSTSDAKVELFSQYVNGRYSKEKQSTSGLASLFNLSA